MGFMFPLLLAFCFLYDVHAFIPRGIQKSSHYNYVREKMSMTNINDIQKTSNILKGIRSLAVSALVGASIIVNPVDAVSSGGRGNPRTVLLYFYHHLLFVS